jgi:hypothetical protein
MQGERTFESTIQAYRGRRFLPIPFDPDQAWGAKSRHCVAGTIDGKGIRGTVELFGGVFGLPLGPVWLRGSDVSADHAVEVVLWAEGPQSANLASDLATAFGDEHEAAAFFDAMPTFYRKNYMRWIDAAKRPETRAARIRETIKDMKEGKRER